MKPIRNKEDIENLKTDEKLIECLNGEVNYYPKSRVNTFVLASEK